MNEGAGGLAEDMDDSLVLWPGDHVSLMEGQEA